MATASFSPSATPAERNTADPIDAPPGARRRSGLVRGTVLALLLGLVAAFLAVPQAASARTTIHAKTSAERSIANAVLRTLNAERRAHHLAPLSGDSRLRLSARRHNATMARYNSMSHQLPGEAYFSKRVTAAGYKWRAAGENIAWNSRMNTQGVVQLEVWMYNEKAPYNGHRLNILNRNFRNVGVDVYVDRAHHKIWLTTDFGLHR